MPLDPRDPFFESALRNVVREEIGTLPQLVRQLQGEHVVEDWREIGATGEPAFANSWVNYDAGATYSTAAFYKDPFEIVHLKGAVKSGTSGVAIFTLPVGYRPERWRHWPVLSNGAFGLVQVLANGEVQLSIGSNASVDLSPVQFRASA